MFGLAGQPRNSTENVLSMNVLVFKDPKYWGKQVKQTALMNERLSSSNNLVDNTRGEDGVNEMRAH